MIYLDNAATGAYKPEGVVRAVESALKNYTANPGRSGHTLSLKAADKVYKIREKIAEFFGAEGGENVIFTANCTESINMVLKGVLNKGDGLIISNLEHNALARPAMKMKAQGYIKTEIFNALGGVDFSQLEKLVNSNTKMIFCSHASNVCGKITDIEKIGAFCQSHGLLFGVDAAQTAGIVPINMKKMNIDFLCAAPHKGMFAPMGTGLLIARKRIPKTIIEGGTGTASLSLTQPDDMPERMESGTVNLPGILGIGAGIDFIKSKGMKNIRNHEGMICKAIFDGIKNIDGVTVYSGSDFFNEYAPILSFTVKGMTSAQAADMLNKKGIAVRGGYQCAPLAHDALGTLGSGTVRVSPGINSRLWDANYFVKTLGQICCTNHPL